MDKEHNITYYQEEIGLNIKDFLRIISKRKTVLIGTVSVVMFLTIILTFSQVPLYKATALLLIEKPEESALTTKEILTISNFDESYYQTQYEILKSRSLLLRVMKALKIYEWPDFMVKEDPILTLSKMINIEPLKRSRLVKVSVLYKDAKMATKMANTLTGLYVEQNIESLLFMSKEILKAFPETAERFENETIYGELKEMSKDELLKSLPAVINNPIIQQVKSEKIGVESEIADFSKRYKPKHPKMSALTTKLKYLNHKLELETERVISSMRAKLAGDLQANNIRVIDYADIPLRPAKPNKRLNLILGFLFSLFLGTSVISIIEHIDTTIQTKADVEKDLKLSVLGEIPKVKSMIKGVVKSSNLLYLLNNDAAFREAIEILMTNIIFSFPEKEYKTLLMSSTIPREGKSCLSSSIATYIAKQGKKVLLVDADMRRPQIDKIFEVGIGSGMSNFLTGASPVEECIKESPVENLYIMTAGTKAQDPPRLLNLKKALLKEMIDSLRDEYDRIIIDSPPALMFADAKIILHACDAMLLVIRAGHVDKDAVRGLIKDLKKEGNKIVDIVLNSIDTKTYPNYYYYHKTYSDYYKKKGHHHRRHHKGHG
ncbi:MAG: polysaccharide biosynthesis tyrosine autokinase [Candidatus Omnitrophica bacterium]|nr:polysaccharide biosynthesis tyrosine autokinase [Candidatus Omnitrophota bacterium]